MLCLANDIDGYVPAGATTHQDLLDQMLVAIADRRPALIDQHLYAVLVEIKNFRHLVRHRYGFDMDPARVTENLERIGRAFPKFVEAVRALEHAMTTST